MRQRYDEAVLGKSVNLCKLTALRLRYDRGTKTTSFPGGIVFCRPGPEEGSPGLSWALCG
ncbi:hypothetical protein [Bradyrhizobium glycinis]|uniref:hypothetical protein n=1 Tax=Bradyrhizobium glycinis TaxID=2751812 RepID=UPI0018D768C2|nr:hypothetical protein [Bradyrhizobium glycinis]MBH5371380.1 hypothetical protein [Bradyrhizobium glycinis]